MSSLKAYVHTTRSFRTGLGLRKHKKTKFIYLRFVDPNPPSPLGVRLVLAFVLALVLAFVRLVFAFMRLVLAFMRLVLALVLALDLFLVLLHVIALVYLDLDLDLVFAFVRLVLAFALALVSLVLFSLRHVAVQVTGKAEGTQVAFLVQVFHNWPVFALDGRSQPFCMPT